MKRFASLLIVVTGFLLVSLFLSCGRNAPVRPPAQETAAVAPVAAIQPALSAAEAPADLDALVAFLKKNIGGDWRNDRAHISARFDSAEGKGRVYYKVHPLDIKAFHKQYSLGYSEIIPARERFLGSSDRFTVLEMRDFAAAAPPESEKLMTLLKLKPVDDAEVRAVNKEGDAYRQLFETYRAQIADAAKALDKDAVARITEQYNASIKGALASAYVWKTAPDGKEELLLGKEFVVASSWTKIHYAWTGKVHVTDCGDYVRVENDADAGGLQIRLSFKPGTPAAEAPVKARRAHVFITGQVQGVGFRDFTQHEATKRGLAGWVKNLEDGRVEAVIEGPADKVAELLELVKRGPPNARVDKVETADETPTGEFKVFSVRR
jgi:acylphosphatase